MDDYTILSYGEIAELLRQKENIENVILVNTGQEKGKKMYFLVYFSLNLQNERWLYKVYTSFWEEEHRAEKSL